MLPSPLQHLILDPVYGYLYPHRQAITVLGLPNEYQLNKHRPHLIEGQDWHKIRGTDHVDRVFYSLSGLEHLSQLVATPQAQAFWQLVQQYTQSGGALMQHHSPSLEGQPSQLSKETDTIDRLFSSLSGVEGFSKMLTTPQSQAFWQSVQQHVQSGGELVRVQPAALYREPDTEVIEPTATKKLQKEELSELLALALAQREPELQYPTPLPTQGSGIGSSPSATLSPQETAAIIFKAQEVLGKQIARNNSRLTLDSDRPHKQEQPTRHEITIWQKWDGYIAAQDGVAFGIVYALLCLLLGFAAYYAVDTLRQPPPPAAHQQVQAP